MNADILMLYFSVISIEDCTFYSMCCFIRIMVPLQQNMTQEIGLLKSEKQKEIVTVWVPQLNKVSVCMPQVCNSVLCSVLAILLQHPLADVWNFIRWSLVV